MHNDLKENQITDFPEPPSLKNTLSTPEQVIRVLRVIRHNVNIGKLSRSEGYTIARTLVDESTAREILKMIEEGEYIDNTYGGTS